MVQVPVDQFMVIIALNAAMSVLTAFTSAATLMVVLFVFRDRLMFKKRYGPKSVEGANLPPDMKTTHIDHGSPKHRGQ